MNDALQAVNPPSSSVGAASPALRILMLEDEPTDAELAERELRKAGLAFTARRVETRETFIQALQDFRPDIVLSDFKLPGFDGLAALEIVRQTHPEIPVIMVTGALRDIDAVELIHTGARDYVLKDRLARLPSAVQRALSMERSSRARKAAEEALRESREKLHIIVDTALDAVVQMNSDGIITGWNAQAENIFGWPRGEAIGRMLHEIIIPPRYREAHLQGIRSFLTTGVGSIMNSRIEISALHRDGHEFPVELAIAPIKIGGTYEFSGFIRDITERKRIEEALLKYHDNTEEEHELAMQVMERLVRPPDFGEMLHCWSMPTARFNGDMIVAGSTPNGCMHAILADATGHGLAAALNVIPVIEVFYGMHDKGFPIERIACELNRKLHHIMPADRFVAAVILSIDRNAGEIRVWNGGIPFAVFISAEGAVLHEWRSKNLPLGLLDETQFENELEVFRCDQEGFFFACSDGLLEAEDVAGNPVSEELLLGWLKAETPDRVKYITEQLRLHLGPKIAHDDVSFLIAPFHPRVTQARS